MKQGSSPDIVEGYEISQATLKLMKLLGQVDGEGRLRSDGRDKIAQVLAFLPLMEKVISRSSRKKPIRVLECACGKGHLGLILNQILSERVERKIQFIGVDSWERLVDKCRDIAENMGYDNVEYHHSDITSYIDEREIIVLLSLHACDTATDEALVKGIELGCRYIFLVPCCQSEILDNLRQTDNPILLPMTGNYTHRKILGSLLTDSLRRLVLESFGYKTDVFEYVSVRRTEKNVMIRGTSGAHPSMDSWSLYQRTLKDLGLDIKLDRMLREKNLRPSF